MRDTTECENSNDPIYGCSECNTTAGRSGCCIHSRYLFRSYGVDYEIIEIIDKINYGNVLTRV